MPLDYFVHFVLEDDSGGGWGGKVQSGGEARTQARWCSVVDNKN
jgi:hypothetical protein